MRSQPPERLGFSRSHPGFRVLRTAAVVACSALALPVDSRVHQYKEGKHVSSPSQLGMTVASRSRSRPTCPASTSRRCSATSQRPCPAPCSRGFRSLTWGFVGPNPTARRCSRSKEPVRSAGREVSRRSTSECRRVAKRRRVDGSVGRSSAGANGRDAGPDEALTPRPVYGPDADAVEIPGFIGFPAYRTRVLRARW